MSPTAQPLLAWLSGPDAARYAAHLVGRGGVIEPSDVVTEAFLVTVARPAQAADVAALGRQRLRHAALTLQRTEWRHHRPDWHVAGFDQAVDAFGHLVRSVDAPASEEALGEVVFEGIRVALQRAVREDPSPRRLRAVAVGLALCALAQNRGRLPLGVPSKAARVSADEQDRAAAAWLVAPRFRVDGPLAPADRKALSRLFVDVRELLADALEAAASLDPVVGSGR